ncbi:MAG: bifunctional diaminohydroxyphosphoribosylaminopyrimidine deaminase/5-amino-6-(5-phosphoribosylamino)uracil reductase RibD, partial [Myxococcota bacterium]
LGATTGQRGPHAEIVALDQAKEAAMGATLYVTLEPCSHFGVTPPCAHRVVEAGIKRCVVALKDPDTRVAGQGIEYLRRAGIQVDVGVLASAAAEQLAPYLCHRRTGRPYVVLKMAASLDGRTAAPDWSSQWITCDKAREDVHHLRADCDAILVGAGTVRLDDPQLTVRPASLTERQPKRIVLGPAEPHARIHPCTEMTGDLGDILDQLGQRGILQLLVEGGASVAHAFHNAGLVDRYVLYLAPALFGGDDARGLFAGPGVANISEVWRGEIDAVRKLGADLRIDILPKAQNQIPAVEAVMFQRSLES